MNNSALKYIAALALMLASSGAQAQQKAHAAPKAARPSIFVVSEATKARALLTVPGKETLINSCGSTPPVATRIIKFRINDKFDVKSTSREMVSRGTSPGAATPVPEPVITPGISTIYDMLLNNDVWAPTDKIVALKIFIKDKKLHFLDKKYSVTTDDSNPSMFICLSDIDQREDKPNTDDKSKPDKPTKDKWDTVTVYIDRSIKQTQPFNIRLLIVQSINYVLPIILDPKVENRG